MHGLTSAEALHQLKKVGYNEIAEKKDSLLKKIFKRSLSPISAMLFLAAGLSYWSGKDFDGSFILILLVINVGMTVWQEHKADTAIEKLNEHLATMVRTLRDGEWREVASRELVPGDMVRFKSGDVVPADVGVLEADSLSANEAVLTGESLPKEKKVGDSLYSGSFLSSGLVTGTVTATGSRTFFGKSLSKVDTSKKQSALEKEILRISRFLSFLSLAAVAALTFVLVASSASLTEVLRLDLSLVIAGIPISLPTVTTLIITFGAVALASKSVIVRRLSALEELANTDFLLTDKTGTLTRNKIVVEEVISYSDAAEDDVLRLSSLVAREEPEDVMNAAILLKAPSVEGVKMLKFIPGDSERKRSTATVDDSGKTTTLSLGAPQVISALCRTDEETRKKLESDVDGLARRGYRTIALGSAEGESEEGMRLTGIIALSDELRSDAQSVIEFLSENGIGVAMVTGDHRAIAREISDKLHIPGTEIYGRQELLDRGIADLAEEDFKKTRAFAEILPEDKYELVKSAKRYFTVAANGDGVNDLPAVKEASVGFAVSNAVGALKGAADIVLTTDGISVMRDAFVEGRKIFARLYTYSVYRISESFRLVVTIAVLGILTRTYPLSPLQLILLALLNDIPIISLAFDRVEVGKRPAKINVREQFSSSVLYGSVGVFNSLALFFLATYALHLPLPVVETLFFLKLTVSGHLLIYVVHTKRRWWRYLPSREVMWATAVTQAIATVLALTGLFMPSAISWQQAVFIWAWSIFFMQVSEAVKRHEKDQDRKA